MQKFLEKNGKNVILGHDHEFVVQEFRYLLEWLGVQQFMDFIWFLPPCKIVCNVKTMLPGQT